MTGPALAAPRGRSTLINRRRVFARAIEVGDPIAAADSMGAHFEGSFAAALASVARAAIVPSG